MKRRSFLHYLSIGGLLALRPRAARGAAGPGPNLLFVFADQWRGQALGFLGEDPVLTPNLDRFAGEALVLPQAVSNYPVCSPYRAMLMTGTYPHANTVVSNCTSRTAAYGCELKQDARCWSDVLKEKGYSLGYIGKWHLDGPRKPYVESYNNRPDFAWNEWCPPVRRHGFDFWYAYGTFDQHNNPEYWSTDMTRDERDKVHRWGPEHETDLALKYLRNEGGRYRRAGAPFALVVSYNPPHTPYTQVPERYVGAYENKTWRDLLVRPNVDAKAEKGPGAGARASIKHYFAQITGVDDQFGRLVKGLAELGLDRDTIVVFTSDHGNCVGSHNHDTKNVHYEESMRVPFLVRWPGKIPARREDLLLSSPDIAPTLLDLMGWAGDIPPAMQGVSHACVFRGEDGLRPTSQLYLWMPVEATDQGRRGVRTARYTLMMSRQDGRPDETVLHDNREDPYQMKNIAADRPDLVAKLVAEELKPWLKKTGDPWIRHLSG